MFDKLEDYIMVQDNAITHALCDAILEEFSNGEEWETTVVGNDAVIDPKIRNAETILISYPHVIDKNHERRKAIDNNLFESAAGVIQKYNQAFADCFIEQDSGYQLLRYKEGQFYSQHTDSFKSAPRAVSCSFALNDDYEGGGWGFWNRKKVVKLAKGSAILFPSNFMYPHEIMPVTKGTRYSIITWFI